MPTSVFHMLHNPQINKYILYYFIAMSQQRTSIHQSHFLGKWNPTGPKFNDMIIKVIKKQKQLYQPKFQRVYNLIKQMPRENYQALEKSW